MLTSDLESVVDWHGWEALVALATLGLAFVTYRLVAATVTLAGTARDELDAAWRPVMLRDRDRTRERTLPSGTLGSHTYEDPAISDPAAAAVTFRMVNQGQGVAIATYILLRMADDGHTPQEPFSPGAYVRTREVLNVAVGEAVVFTVPWTDAMYDQVVGKRMDALFICSYTDVGQNTRFETRGRFRLGDDSEFELIQVVLRKGGDDTEVRRDARDRDSA